MLLIDFKSVQHIAFYVKKMKTDGASL